MYYDINTCSGGSNGWQRTQSAGNIYEASSKPRLDEKSFNVVEHIYDEPPEESGVETVSEVTTASLIHVKKPTRTHEKTPIPLRRAPSTDRKTVTSISETELRTTGRPRPRPVDLSPRRPERFAVFLSEEDIT